jgi:hypothetical protein
MSAVDPKRTFGGQYLENLNELDPRLPSRLTAADRLAQLRLFNLIDNAVLQQSRIKILFRMALSVPLFLKRYDQKRTLWRAKAQLCVQLFARHSWLHLPFA